MSEFGLGEKLAWHGTRASFYHEGRYYGFGTPLDLLRFSAVPTLQRLRFGIPAVCPSRASPATRHDASLGNRLFLV